MPDLLLLAVPAVPLLLAAALLAPTLRAAAIVLAPLGALPAVAVALGPERSLSAPWLLLGAELRADQTAQAFLLFSSALWLMASLAARSYVGVNKRRTGFFAGFLLAMAGNLGLLVAADVFSFYTLFALMSFSSYALVVHVRSADALFAGRVYIAFVVLGELALFAGLSLAAHAAGSTLLSDVRSAHLTPVATALVVAGFCVKLGIAPFHLWLPLAHAAAPVPASAVLSGAMIKSGLFGLITLLPLGETALPAAGDVLMLAGAASIVLAAAIGVTQRSPKAVLAYSSIGQMGLAAVALGVALDAPASWEIILPTLLFFAAHHALTKGALFLGVGALAGASGVASRRAILFGLALLAAALAAAPFTAGALAKAGLKEGIGSIHPDSFLLDVLTFSSLATALLMTRFLVLLSRSTTVGPALAASWLGLVAAAAALPSAWPMVTGHALPAPGSLVETGLPIAVALLLAFATMALFQATGVTIRPVPPGEVLALFERGPAPIAHRQPAPRACLTHAVPRLLRLPAPAASWQAGATATAAVLVAMAALELSDRPLPVIGRPPDAAGSPPQSTTGTPLPP